MCILRQLLESQKRTGCKLQICVYCFGVNKCYACGRSTTSIPVVKKPSVYVKLVDGGSATNATIILNTAVAARNISARDTIVSLIANLASFVTVDRVRMSSGASIARTPVLNIVLVGDKRQQREQRHPNCFVVNIMRCERYRFIYILPSCFQC